MLQRKKIPALFVGLPVVSAEQPPNVEDSGWENDVFVKVGQ